MTDDDRCRRVGTRRDAFGWRQIGDSRQGAWEQQALVGQLQSILRDLGLERRVRPVPDLAAYLAEKARPSIGGTSLHPGARPGPPATPGNCINMMVLDAMLPPTINVTAIRRGPWGSMIRRTARRGWSDALTPARTRGCTGPTLPRSALTTRGDRCRDSVPGPKVGDRHSADPLASQLCPLTEREDPG